MSERLWSAYDEMGQVYADHAADSAYNAHYDRPAVLGALGPVAGLRLRDVRAEAEHLELDSTS